jgi:hypothetical protein
MTGLFEGAGAQPKNPSRGKPITPALRFETGIFTNRSPLHDPSSWIYSHFYQGYQDTLIDGLNMEISNQLTLVRRPGLSQWSTIPVPTQPNWFYNWNTLDQGVKVVVDTASASFLQTAGTQTQIFGKTVGAGQGYYQGVADTLYSGDGVDLQKYILPAGTVWNWGIATPTVAPTLTITPSASASTVWAASTVFPTMGMIVDSNGNIQQLISVNATGTNSTQLGTTGNGNPAWNQIPQGTTTDNGWNWTNWGPIGTWQAHKVYNDASTGGSLTQPCIIYDATTKCCFIVGNSPTGPGTSGGTKPNFSSASGSSVQDNPGGPGLTWFNIGLPLPWIGSHSYNAIGGGRNSNTGSAVEPQSLVNGLPVNQTIFWQVNNTGLTQTSSASGINPPWSTLTGGLTTDNQLIWLNLGSSVRQTNHSYTPWTANQTVFSAIVDKNNNYQVCITATGASSAQATTSINWSTGYGQQTSDGGVTWMCVGPKMSWAANTQWFLPAAGWFPPGGSVTFGGAVIVDSNNNIQAVIQSGKSSTVAPTWATTPVGTTTNDNAAKWILIGPASTVGFSWATSVTYAYSYTSRTTTDTYNSTAPPDWPAPLGAPIGAGSGHVSTASPLTKLTGANPGATVTLTIPRSTDPQVDTITIWKTLDGGSTLFFLTEVPNPPAATPTQTVVDSQPFTVVNQLIPAPINGSNNPPPAGFLPMAYHFERIWGAVGNFVYCSGGGDVLTGNPNESFDPQDFFQFPSPVTKIVPTATGILVFLTNNVYAILGGPVFDTFFPSPMVPGVGLLHYNALDVHGGVIYLFTADNQFISFDPSGGAQRMGGPIADKLQFFNSNNTFVTVHESGNDNCIIVADGATGWYRLNPSQFPNGSQVWSPFAAITGGAGAVLSIEVSQGVHRLLVGGVGNNANILQRDFTTFRDNGTPYTCFGTIGSLVLAQPGQIAGVTFANVRCVRTGTAPTVSFLLNEISGAFTTFPQAQAYPWQIYGQTGQPSSLYSNAYYFRAAGVPALCEHLQIKVAFPAENFQNEVLTMSLFGVVEQSPED